MNKELRGYADQLEHHGHVVTSRWISGEHEALDSELLSPINRRLAQKFFEDDMQDLLVADALIAFTEPADSGFSRGGRHVEFGIALAAGLRLFVVGPRENLFYLASRVRHYWTFEELYLDLCIPRDVAVAR